MPCYVPADTEYHPSDPIQCHGIIQTGVIPGDEYRRIINEFRQIQRCPRLDVLGNFLEGNRTGSTRTGIHIFVSISVIDEAETTPYAASLRPADLRW